MKGKNEKRAVFQRLLVSGCNSFNSQKYEQALESFEKALLLNPEHCEAWSNKGMALAILSRYAEASESFKKATELDAEHYRSWAGWGLSLAHLGCYAKAVESFDKASELDSKDGELWFSKGTALAHLSRYAEAVQSFDKAVELNPDDASAWDNRGLCLANLGHYAQAIESYNQAIELNPDHALTWNNKGLSLASLECYAEAIELYDKALKLNAKKYQIWFNRGLALYKLNRYAEAFESYEKVVKLNPQYHPAWQNRAGAICKISNQQLDISDLLSWIKGRSIAKSLGSPDPHVAALREALFQLKAESVSWAHIHLVLGDIFMKHSRLRKNVSLYRRNAIRSYHAAYTILTREDHLSVLQGLVRAYFALEDFPSARKFQQEGQALFAELLSAQPESQKDAFARKFVSFSQLEIDLLISEQKPIAALEQAEFYKNRCLTWIMDGWDKPANSPSYTDFQTLTSPNKAILY